MTSLKQCSWRSFKGVTEKEEKSEKKIYIMYTHTRTHTYMRLITDNTSERLEDETQRKDAGHAEKLRAKG